ncbi:hypothetical protein ACFPYJ_26465 [Paenibacillus solisilvae]|uniref:Uncharacterized protein n=1 Tax=Paenibacillus solisilvae TaxID=2486751 RepID=A0ABW0W6D3_9BACL
MLILIRLTLDPDDEEMCLNQLAEDGTDDSEEHPELAYTRVND